MCRTLAFFETIERREHWLDRYTQWMDADKRAAILDMSPHWYSKKSLGQHLELYDEDRELLQVRSIERRTNGIKPREEYLASVKGPEPWKALKMSRTKYYELGFHRRTGSDTHLSSINLSPRPVVPDTDTNVVPFKPRPNQATSPAVAGTNNMLTWHPMTSCNGIYADTNGLGRFVIKTGDYIVLKRNSDFVDQALYC